jgi:hypothetical protein
MDAKKIAVVCHEANRALQTVDPDPTIAVSPPWDLEKAETRESAIQGVQAHLDDPTLTPEQSHQIWCEFKEDHGWKLGPVKDNDKKEHPLLVPYSELPAKQQIKDALFSAIVRTLADA